MADQPSSRGRRRIWTGTLRLPVWLGNVGFLLIGVGLGSIT